MKKLTLVFGPLVGIAIIACAGNKEPSPADVVLYVVAPCLR